MMCSLHLIEEGKAKIYTDYLGPERGPGKSGRGVFYNPAMKLCRDVSVAVLSVFLSERKNATALDGMAGTGIRGIRYHLENNCPTVMNEINKKSYSLMVKNMKMNGIDIKYARNDDIRCVVRNERFDFIDIDPFGSPAFYIDAGVSSIVPGGVICATATDTAALCGSNKKPCIRRYWAEPLKCHVMHEIGIRILLGFMARTCARYDRFIKPILSHSTDHYMRVYVKVMRGARKADKQIHSLGYFILRGLTWSIEKHPPKEKYAGPLWTDEIHDLELLKKVREKMVNEKEKRFISILIDECNISPFYYTMDSFGRYLNIQIPKIKTMVYALRDEGWKASRTHFNPLGFKTNAPVDVIERLIRKISK